MLRLKSTRTSGNAMGMKGFTLTELMVTLVILGLIMSVVYKVFSSQERFFRNQEQVSAMQENLRATMEYVNQELSWMGYSVPGVAIVKAAPTDIIFQANIPNTGQTIQYVRYQFNPSTHTISRAAGASETDIENADLIIMASDIESLSFSYYNVLNGVLVVDPTDPPCADELPSAVCAPGTPGGAGGDSSLLMIQRVKARVTARTSKPDWQYTDPEGGANPNYRKRKAVLDLKARNVEDVTLQGGQIILGTCGDLNWNITVPGSTYAACKDKTYQTVNYRPDPGGTNWYDDNPAITINALDVDGNLNTNAGRVAYVYAVADDGTPFNIYDGVDPFSVANNIDNGETRYLSAQELSTVSEGTEVYIRFAYSDGVCTQVTYGENSSPATTPVLLASGTASQFVSQDAVGDPMVTTAFVTASTAGTISPQPAELTVCSQAADMGVRLNMFLADDCSNGIEGETVAWSDNGAGGSFTSQTDAGDGNYSALYIPPDNLSTVISQEDITVDVTWNAEVHPETFTLIPAAPHNIIIDDIVELSGSGVYQFASSPDVDNASTFEIEKVDGQLVGISFHLEDECGNRVYNENTSISVSASAGALGAWSEDSNGVISFTWDSDVGCGAVENDHTITITSSAIANIPTSTELITFDLLETVSGPRLILGVSSPGQLYAGDTTDSVTIDARVEEYDEALQLCYNVPGPFDVAMEVTGDGLGSGSFSGSDHEQTTDTITTAGDGTGTLDLYPGTAKFNENLTVTGTANVGGAFYPNAVSVGMLPSTVDPTFSGFMESDYNELNKVGVDEADRSYDPGETVYIQIKDFDENESPLFQDSLADPWTSVTLTVERTGDVEIVRLSEDLSNTALFRDSIDTQHNAVALSGDGVLQVMYGDMITMHYEDKDDPTDFDNWDVFTSGPRWMKLTHFEAGIYTDIFSGGLQVEDIEYEDDIHIQLYYPEFETDGDAGSETDSAVVDSGSDGDTVTMREYADTGILEIDNGSGLFRVTKNDPGDLVDQLFIETTPRSVTVSYPNSLGPIIEQTFTMYDQDVPEVVITSPAAGPVAGTVLISVNASDPYNTTAAGGISRIELYINGRLFDSVVGADLSGDNPFDWVTVIPVNQPTWLDGTHVITARVWDTANNSNVSLPVTVNLNNNLFPIEFTSPSYASVWGSMDISVVTNVSNMAAESGTFDVYLSVDGGPAWLMTDLGGNNFGSTLDGRTLTEGWRSLIATVQDTQGNFQWTALDFEVDRTPPEFYSWWDDPINAPKRWINYWDATPPMSHWFDFEAADLHGFIDSTSVALVTVSGVPNGYTNQPAWWNWSWFDGSLNRSGYAATWSAPIAGYVGSLTYTVTAQDTSNPPNVGTYTSVFSVDTKLPTIDAPVVSPAIGSLLSGTVTLTTNLNDDYPWFVLMEGYWYDEVAMAWNYQPGLGDGWPPWPLPNNVDPVGPSSAFAYTWDTTMWPDGAYYVQLGGWDRAENEVQDWWMTPYVYFVDNSSPVCSQPYVAKPNNIVDGRVNVRYSASDSFGIIKAVAVYIMADGQHPSTDLPLSTEVVALPFDTSSTSNTTISGIVSMDVNALTSGQYDVYCLAEDWAGNQSLWSPGFNLRLDRTYLIDAWGYYSRTGINYDLKLGGTLYENGLPAVGETVRLYYRVRPSGISTYDPGVTFYTTTGPAGAYSYEYPLNLNPGDYFYAYHYSPLDNILAFNNATIPNAVNSNYTSYGPIGEQVRDLSIRFVEQPTLDYSLEVNGTLYNNSGSVPGNAMRLHVNLYDDANNYITFVEYLGTTDAFGGFTFDTWPLDLFLDGQNLYVYLYDQVTGKQLGYAYGLNDTYDVPGPLSLHF